jgi:hypothetical protein
MTRGYRGLFRAWLVISLVWMIFIAAVWQAEIRLVYAPIIMRDGAQEIAFPANTPLANVRKGLTDYLKERDAKAPPPPPGYTLDPINYGGAIDKIMGDYKPRSFFTVLLEGGEIALSPPIALLMFGLAVRWIIKGFKNSGSPA